MGQGRQIVTHILGCGAAAEAAAPAVTPAATRELPWCPKAVRVASAQVLLPLLPLPRLQQYASSTTHSVDGLVALPSTT